MKHFNQEEILLGIAFLATLVVFLVLSILADPTGRLEDLLIALGGAIAGVTVTKEKAVPNP